MSESWEDIVGSSEKPEKSLVELVKPKKLDFKHESEEETARRRARALEAVFRTFTDPKFQPDGLLTAERGGKKFDFWPASDCYFSYSTQKYGNGIEKLCSLVEKHLAPS